MGERRTTEDHRDDAGDQRGDAGATHPSTAARRVETGATGPNAASSGNGQRQTTADDPRVAGIADDGDVASDDADGASAVGGAIENAVERVTAVEAWTPFSQAGGDVRPVRRALRPDESLQLVAPGELLGNDGGPATAGLTDDRLVVATDDGLVSVGFDRLCAVRSSIDTALGVRGKDARVFGGVGYVLSVVAFLGVLGVASNPLTPALALATVGGALAFGHVRREGLALNGTTLTDWLRRFGPVDELADGLAGVERRLPGGASDDPVALWTAGAVALAPFAALVALEPGLLAPLFALLTVGSFTLVVHAVRHSDEFDGMEVVRTRRRTVVATADDGSAVVVRTRPDSPFDRELAARVGRSYARSTGTGGD